jgi:hypothetical protein
MSGGQDRAKADTDVRARQIPKHICLSIDDFIHGSLRHFGDEIRSLI